MFKSHLPQPQELYIGGLMGHEHDQCMPCTAHPGSTTHAMYKGGWILMKRQKASIVSSDFDEVSI
jgi:hypothetical protein